MTLEKLWVNIGSYFKEKVDVVYVGGICNDKEQLNLRKRVSTRDSVLFIVPFSALLNAGCFCLTEYCIHWELLSCFDEWEKGKVWL